MATNITMYRGRTYDFIYMHTDTEGNPVSLEGKTVYFTAKPVQFDSDNDDSSATIQATKEPEDHEDAALGITVWILDDEKTYKDPGSYFYDVIVEDENGYSDPPSLSGSISLIGTPTNRNVGNEPEVS